MLFRSQNIEIWLQTEKPKWSDFWQRHLALFYQTEKLYGKINHISQIDQAPVPGQITITYFSRPQGFLSFGNKYCNRFHWVKLHSTHTHIGLHSQQLASPSATTIRVVEYNSKIQYSSISDEELEQKKKNDVTHPSA